MKVYFYQIQLGTRVNYVVGQTYNILYWSKGKLLEMRGTVVRVTSTYVQLDVIEEG